MVICVVVLYILYTVKMTDNSIDLSLKNIWRCWYAFRRGKRQSKQIAEFEYNLEQNLWLLYLALNNGTYTHGGYQQFVVHENKKRLIKVAGVADRVVHRLVYEYLVAIYDQSFGDHVWSCRKGKGLLGAQQQAQHYLKLNKTGYFWRADISKFFDNVDRQVLLALLKLKITDNHAILILDQIINADNNNLTNKVGIPIGNLTSQIFANIYLHQLDTFILSKENQTGYVRYGDDFVVFGRNLDSLLAQRELVINHLHQVLRLKINNRHNIILPTHCGLKYLGLKIYGHQWRLNKRNNQRWKSRLNSQNVSSYRSLLKKYSKQDLPIFNHLLSAII